MRHRTPVHGSEPQAPAGEPGSPAAGRGLIGAAMAVIAWFTPAVEITSPLRLGVGGVVIVLGALGGRARGQDVLAARDHDRSRGASKGPRRSSPSGVFQPQPKPHVRRLCRHCARRLGRLPRHTLGTVRAGRLHPLHHPLPDPPRRTSDAGQVRSGVRQLPNTGPAVDMNPPPRARGVSALAIDGRLIGCFPVGADYYSRANEPSGLFLVPDETIRKAVGRSWSAFRAVHPKIEGVD